MTETEIDRRLALAIGYTAKRVRLFGSGWPFHCAFIQVLNHDTRNDGPMQYDGWQRFDHTAPTVIWLIAERFNAFPKWQYNGRCEFIGWHCWAKCRGYGAHANPATASALAVIRYVEGK